MSEHFNNEDDLITPKSRVPLYFVYSVLATILPLAIYGTFLWANIRSEVRGKVSYYELQQHDYDLKLLNPTIILPPPIKPESAVGYVEPKDLLKPEKLTLR